MGGCARILVLGVAFSGIAIGCTGGDPDEPPSSAERVVGGDGLVAAYSFDEGSGTIAHDVSGHRHDGVLGSNGGSPPTWSGAGKHGGAVAFGAAKRGWVTIADAADLDLTTAMTLEAWVLPSSVDTYDAILVKEQPGELVYGLYASNSDAKRPEGIIFSAGAEHRAAGGAAVPIATWTHLATTYDGANVRLYVGGHLVATTSAPSPMPASSGALRIGGDSVWGEYFTGLVDDVRIYGRALTASEIAADMLAAAAGSGGPADAGGADGSEAGPDGGPGPGSTDAGPSAPVGGNLWVDVTGGTCTRSAAPAAYADASACASLDAAYQAAHPGDIVLVKSGVYSDQVLHAKATTGPAVVVQAAPGESPVVEELDVDGASWITLRDLTVRPHAGLPPWDQIIDLGRCSHVTLDRIVMDGRIAGAPQTRDGLGINGATDYVTIENSDLGHILGRKLIIIQTYATSIQNTHLTLSHNDIHDDPQTDAGNHLECLWLEGISDFLMEANHFYDCALNMILADADEGGTYANWTVVNNVFERADQGVGIVPQDMDGCAAQEAKANWVFAYNYLPRGMFLTSCGGDMSFLTVRGNLGAAGDVACPPTAHFAYNVWTQRKCSATDVLDPNALADANFVAPLADKVKGPGNYRPASGSAPQVNAGDPSSWPTTDADLVPRPVGPRPDVGPYEFH